MLPINIYIDRSIFKSNGWQKFFVVAFKMIPIEYFIKWFINMFVAIFKTWNSTNNQTIFCCYPFLNRSRIFPLRFYKRKNLLIRYECVKLREKYSFDFCTEYRIRLCKKKWTAKSGYLYEIDLNSIRKS